MSDHYFSAQPASADDLRERSCTILGKEYTITTAAGVFSHNRLDKGTQVLLKYVADPPTGGLLVDLGCGWGPLTLALAQASPQAHVLAVDINERARELTALNAERAGLSNVTVMDPEEGLELAHAQGIAALWSNPPVRIGKAAMRELLTTWLKPLTGYADIVVSKNLGADSLATWLKQNHEVTKLGSSNGFRVFEIR